jgi:hypothetical protein
MYGNYILKKLYDFGDSFIEQLLGKSNVFGRMFLILDFYI